MKVFSGSRSRLAGINGSTQLQNASVTSHDLAPIYLNSARTKTVLSANYGQALKVTLRVMLVLSAGDKLELQKIVNKRKRPAKSSSQPRLSR